jgi:hypothetical protein
VGLSIETSRWQTKKLLKEIAREHHPIVRLGMGLKGGPRIFFILIFFNQINIFGQNFFLNLVLFSCASPVDVIYEEVMSYALMCARCTTLVGTMPRQSSHIICSCTTHEAVASIYLARLLCKIGHPSFSFFLPSSSLHLAVAPLVILEFSPLFKTCGAINRLHEWVLQSCWVHVLSLPSHFVVF